MFPRPTAEPVAASIKIQRDDHSPWIDLRAMHFPLAQKVVIFGEILNIYNCLANEPTKLQRDSLKI